MKITIRGWLKEQEIVVWGEDKEAIAAKNRFMGQLGSLQGRRIGYQHDIEKR